MQTVIDALYGDNEEGKRARIYCEWIRVPLEEQRVERGVRQTVKVQEEVRPLTQASLSRLVRRKHSLRRRIPSLAAVAETEETRVVEYVGRVVRVLAEHPWHVVFESDSHGSRMYPWGRAVALHVPIPGWVVESGGATAGVERDELHGTARAAAMPWINGELARVVSRPHLVQTWIWTVMRECPPSLILTVRGILVGAATKFLVANDV